MQNKVSTPHSSGGSPLLLLATGHASAVVDVAFSPDGKTIASAGYDGFVILWDVNEGTIKRKLPIQVDDTKIDFSPNGRLIAASSYLNTWLWEVETGELIHLYDELNSVESFADDGKCLIGWTDRNDAPVVWNIERSVPIFSLPLNGSLMPVNSSRDILAVLEDQSVQIFNLQNGKMLNEFATPEEVSQSGTPAAISPDASLIAIPHPESTAVYEVTSGRSVLSLPAETVATFSPDGAILATDSGVGQINLWDSKILSFINMIHTESESIRTLAFSPDSSILAGAGDDRSVDLWATPSGQLVQRLDGYPYNVKELAFSPDGSEIQVTYTDEIVLSWGNTEGPKQIAAVSASRNIAPPELPELPILRDRMGQVEQVVAAAFSPNNEILAVGYDGTLVGLWNAEGATLIHKLYVEGDFADQLAFSPDGKTLAVGTAYNEVVKLFSVQTGRVKRRLSGHSGDITGLSFSSDGKLLASGAQDGMVKLWNPRNGMLLATLMPLPSEQTEIAWIVYTPEGYYDCSPAAERYIHWYVGTDILPAEEFAELFNRQGLLKHLLSGKQVLHDT